MRVCFAIKSSIVVALTLITVDLSAMCECWVAEQTDEWTDDKSMALFCIDRETEAAVVLFGSTSTALFYDPAARANAGDVIIWEYRIGSGEVERIYQFWKSHEYWSPARRIAPFGLRQEDHLPRLLQGIAEDQRIRFRFRPYLRPEVGPTLILDKCHNGKESAALFSPFVAESEDEAIVKVEPKEPENENDLYLRLIDRSS